MTMDWALADFETKGNCILYIQLSYRSFLKVLTSQLIEDQLHIPSLSKEQSPIGYVGHAQIGRN